MTVKEPSDNCYAVKLVPSVRLRREYFGGLVYDTRNGNTLEVDKAAFQFLSLIQDGPHRISNVVDVLLKNGMKKRYSTSMEDTLQKLYDLRIIETVDGEISSSPPTVENLREGKTKYTSWLSAPETVHWALTYRCDENCPDCYVGRFPISKNELETFEAFGLIDKIAAWKVFQLALGGGEPFAREDLSLLVQHAANCGLSVHVTTGKLSTSPEVLESVLPFIQNLQIGIRTNDLLGPNYGEYVKQLQNFFAETERLYVRPGANLFLSESAIEQLESLVTILRDIGFDRIIFLRYKPPGSIERWKAESPEPYQMAGLHHIVGEIIKKDPCLNIRVDCALSFVQRHLSKEIAAQCGIKGCVAADRILALAPDGTVYPCSQLVHPKYCAGSLLESEPQILWDEARVLRKYRSFATKKVFTNSWCGICLARTSCGGCRVFAMDGLGSDKGCPEPMLPPLREMGKIGRRLDLVEYLKKHLVISVGEYMERYGLTQKRAIAELNVSRLTSSTTGKSARRKIDTYEYVDDDIVRDIQDSIGHTSGGYPFVPYEEVARWIEDPWYTENYPQWIKQNWKDAEEIKI